MATCRPFSRVIRPDHTARPRTGRSSETHWSRSIPLGTTSTRAIVFDGQGELLATAQREHE